MYSIIKFNRPRKIRGFNFQRGFLAVVKDGQIIAATSGWCSGGCHYGDANSSALVYRRRNRQWAGDWVCGSEYRDGRSSPLVMLADVALERDWRFLSLQKEREEREGKAFVAECLAR